MSDFHAIVVGGGLAGITAAYQMAQAGLEVLLVERGNDCGAKNMTGGRIYTHSLERIFPGFPGGAPVERKIVREGYFRPAGDRLIEETYPATALTTPPGDSYSVLRGRFDPWMAKQAEAAGAAIVCGIRVDELLIRDGRVCGIQAGGDEMESDVVILADGVNALLGQKLGLRGALSPQDAVVGVKEVVELAPDLLERRFGLGPREGLAWALPGCLGRAPQCEGFLYTNWDSVSIGIQLPLSSVDLCLESVPQMLEDFRRCDPIAGLLEGGRLAEYSAHLLPRYAPSRLPKRCGGGVLLAGDAAGLCADFGFTLHGMDLAVESGRLAAETVVQAVAEGDFSEESLSGYSRSLERGWIGAYLLGAEACRRTAHTAEDHLVSAFQAALDQLGTVV